MTNSNMGFTPTGSAVAQPHTFLGKSGSGRHSLQYWLAFVMCLGLLLFRGWDRITHPELFAEGVRFLGHALNEGPASLLIAYDFFYHTVPRLIALLAVSIAPVSDIPLYTNALCYLVTAAAMANVARTSYRWLIPSDGARIALVLLFACAPGMIEIMGNIAGIHWPLLLWLATLSMKDPKQPFTVLDLVIVVLIVLTVGASILFIPLAFVRLVYAWRNKNSRDTDKTLANKIFIRELLVFSTLFLMSAYLLFNFVFSEHKVGVEGLDIVEGMRSLDALAIRLGDLLSGFFLLHPFLGTQHTSLLRYYSDFYVLLAIALLVLGILLWLLKRQMDERYWLVMVWLGCIFLIAVMLSFVRYWSFYGMFSAPYWNWWFRYNFIFATSALFFWFILLRPTALYKLNNWRNVLTLVLFAAYTSQANTMTQMAREPHHEDRFAVKRYGPERYWSRNAQELQRSIETGCPKTVKMWGHPREKWHFIYESKIPNDCGDDDPVPANSR